MWMICTRQAVIEKDGEKETAEMCRITIDGDAYEAAKGMTLLQVMRGNGIQVPTLCYHEALKPIGACKLCGVLVTGRSGKPRILLSCVLKVREGLVVKTEGERVQKARTLAFRNLLAMAPQSKRIRTLAESFNVPLGPVADGCIRCRLCIRVCKEVVGIGAIKMAERDGLRLIIPKEGLCIGCGTCANICPTGAIHLADENGVRTISIRDEVIGVNALERCDACGRFFASQKFINHVKLQTRNHAAVKEPHQYCHSCAKLFSNRIKSSSRFKRMR